MPTSMLSLPEPPYTLLNSPPSSGGWSLPSLILSFPFPAYIASSPLPPSKRSLPVFPNSLSSPSKPLMVSALGVPFRCIVSRCSLYVSSHILLPLWGLKLLLAIINISPVNNDATDKKRSGDNPVNRSCI